MDRRTFLKTTGAVAATGSLVAASSGSVVSSQPIQHIVVCMMENRSFDHLLGWLPNANGNQAGLSFTDTTGKVHSTYALAPQDYTGCGHPDPDHSYAGGRTEIDNGKMDGFLLDGAKLASREQRPAYARQFKQMIHALLDNGALVNVKAVEVLATKFDLTKRGNAEEQLKYLDTYERSLTAEFKARGLTVECYRICALPKADQSVGFLGLDEAIKRWTAAPQRPELGPEPIADTPRQIDRMLAKATGDAV